jgi:hypothetical protein
MKRTWIGVVGLGMGLAAAGSASALTVDGTGKVLDGWNVTPFTVTSAPVQSTTNGITGYYQNNYSPINYPGVGHVPSPGGSTGKEFDLEEMYVRQTGTVVNMLLVAASGYTATADGTTYHLGDVLLDLNGDGTYDAGLVSQNFNAGLVAGGLYSGITTQRLQNISGSYYGTSTEAAIGPWAVGSGTLRDQEAISQTTYNYGGGNGLTYLTAFSFDLSKIPGALPTSLTFHLDWGCGNDVISGTYTVTPVVGSPAPGVPEPITAGLSGLGLGALALAALRRRK